MGNEDTYSHNRKNGKDSCFLDYISLDRPIPEEMYVRLKGVIDRLGEETVRKAFLKVRNKIAMDLKRIEEEKKSREGEVNKEKFE